MEFFSFLKGNSDSVPSAAATQPDTGSSSINVNATESAKLVQERVSRRGRPPGSGAKGVEGRGISAEEAKALDIVFAPDTWRGIVKLPSDAATMLTGSKVWELSKPETDTLAAGAAMCARYFVKTDPKWIALMLFSSSLITVYGSRYAAYQSEKAEALKPKPAAPTE